MAVTNKLVYDAVTARLTAQAADQTALTGRAQSLLGAATISATIVGALSNGSLLNVKTSATRFPTWLLIIGGVGFVVVVVSAIWALIPRRWTFSPDPKGLEENISAVPSDDVSDEDAYDSLIQGFITASDSAIPPLQRNDQLLDRLRLLVTIEAIGLAIIVVFGFANVVYLSTMS